MVIPIINTLIVTAPNSSTARYYNESKDPNDRKLTASVGLFQILFSALLLILPLVLIFPKELSTLVLKDSIYARYFIIALTTILFSAIYGYGLNMMRLNFQSAKYSIISIIYLLVQVGLSILLVVVLRMDITGALLAPLITSIPFCFTIMWMTKKNYSWSFSMSRLKELLKFGTPFIPVAILGYILAYADRYFIIDYCSLGDLGLYQIGFSMAGVISMLFAGFHVAWTPITWSTFRDPNAKSFYSQMLDYSFSLAIVVIVAISLFSREILTVFTTEAYLGAYQVVPWLAFSMLFNQVFAWFVPGLGIAKKTVHHIWRVGVAVAVNIGLNFLLVPIYGIVGAAVATLISAAIAYILRLILSQMYYPIHFNFVNYLKVSSIAVGTLLLWHNFLLDISWQNILIKIFLVLLVIASLYFFHLIGKSEVVYMKSALSKVTHSAAREISNIVKRICNRRS